MVLVLILILCGMVWYSIEGNGVRWSGGEDVYGLRARERKDSPTYPAKTSLPPSFPISLNPKLIPSLSLLIPLHLTGKL